MANKVVRILTASSLSAAGLFITSVKAAGSKVHPSELDIYDKPNLIQEVVLEEPPSEMEKKISVGRKQAMSYWSSTKDVFNKGQSLAQTANIKTSEFMELVSTDQTFQIKVAVISSGVLIGGIAAGRGRRPFRRFFYAAGLGSIAFSACYPQKAWCISQKAFEQSKVLFNKMKTIYEEQKQKRLTQPTEEKLETKETKPNEEFVEEKSEPLHVETVAPEPTNTVIEEVIEEIKDVSAISSALDTRENERSYLSYVPFIGWFFAGKTTANNAALPSESDRNEVKVSADDTSVKSDSESTKTTVTEESKKEEVGDHGQSNPEDKDMYSTR